jgi:hypothetical protein
MKQKAIWKRRKWSITRLLAFVSASKTRVTFATLTKRFGLTTRDLVALQWGLRTGSPDDSSILIVGHSQKGPTAKSAISRDLLRLAALDLSETLWAVRALEGAYGGSRYDQTFKGISSSITKGEWKDNYEQLNEFYPEPNLAEFPPEGRVVIDAIQESRVLTFRYKGEKAERRSLKIFSFRKDHDRWYLYGWDTVRNDWRCFLLRDMKEVKLGERWTHWLPEREVEKIREMDLSQYRPTGHEEQVKIKIRKSAYHRFRYLFPLSSTPREEWVTLNLPSNSPEWVARRFLPGLGDVHIVGPERFRQAWLAEIKSVQQIYK